MLEKLNRFSWSNLSNLSVDEKAIILSSRLIQCTSEFVKTVEVNKYTSNKWYDEELKQLRIKRYLAYKNAVIFSRQSFWNH